MNKLIVSSSPHIHERETISSIMSDVIIALVPAALMGVYTFGYRAAVVILTAVAACVATEFFYEKLTKRRITIGDMSAVVTGLLLGLNLPVTIPLYMTVIGSVFAIAVVKQLYGGLGKNFMNPALAARCFMLIAWAGAMTSFTNPGAGYGADAISQATPLAILKGTSEGALPSLRDAFFGLKAGTIGETSGVMLLLGGAYLLIRGVITWHTPVSFIGTVFVLSLILGQDAARQILSGGLLLGAFFMATDYVTAPQTPWGRALFGIGAGLLTCLIRFYGSYAEGVSFAILFMNILTPYLSKWTASKPFGGAKA